MNVLTTGAPERAKLDSLQASLVDLDAQIEQLERARLSPKDAEAVIDRVLERERENVRYLLAQVLDPEGDAHIDLRDVREGGLYRVSPFGLLDAFLGRAAARKAWLTFVTSDPKYEPGLSREERAKRIADLREQRAKLEREEELEALRIEDESGALVLRRREVNVDLLLELWR